MSKLLKSLIIGSVLSTVTPFNFFHTAFAGSNDSIEIEEVEIGNPNDKNYKAVCEYALDKGIDLEQLRTSDNSGMLGPKYNGGSWREATDLVYSLKIDDTTFNSEKESAEVRKCMATIIEHVSIGKKLDFSNGHEQMVKAIVAYMETKDEKTKTNIRKRGTAEATGVRYIAAAVAQEMLINLHKGMFLCALNENYKDACSKVEEELGEAQKNNGWGTPDISGFSIEETKLVLKTIEQAFGSIPYLASDENNLTRKLYQYQEYLMQCSESGMNKLSKELEDKIKGEDVNDEDVNELQSIRDNLQSAIDLSAKVLKTLRLAVDQIKNPTVGRQGLAMTKNNVQQLLGRTINQKGSDKDSDLDADCYKQIQKWQQFVPAIRIKKTAYEDLMSNNPNTANDLSLFDKIQSEVNAEDFDQLSDTQKNLISYGKLINELAKMSNFNWSELAHYRKIIATFCSTSKDELIDFVVNNVDNTIVDMMVELPKEFPELESCYQAWCDMDGEYEFYDALSTPVLEIIKSTYGYEEKFARLERSLISFQKRVKDGQKNQWIAFSDLYDIFDDEKMFNSIKDTLDEKWGKKLSCAKSIYDIYKKYISNVGYYADIRGCGLQISNLLNFSLTEFYQKAKLYVAGWELDQLSYYICQHPTENIKHACDIYASQKKLDNHAYKLLSDNQASLQTVARMYYSYITTFREHFLKYINNLYQSYLKKARLFTNKDGDYDKNSKVYWIGNDSGKDEYIWLKMDREYCLTPIADNFVGLKDGFINVNKKVKDKLSFTNKYYNTGNDNEVSFFCVIKE